MTPSTSETNDEASESLASTADRVSGRVLQQSEATSEIVTVFKEIADQTNLLALNAVNEISHVLHEQSAASELIARNVEQVATMNEENTSAVHGVVADVHRLRALGGQLRDAAASFRV